MDFSNFTIDQIQSAREYAAGHDARMAVDCLKPGFYADHITPEQARDYSLDHLRNVADIVAGLRDNNFTIRQRMHYFLTGESVAFLPKPE